MGIIWRFTMPLLTTLAALVIIVHSAEEDFDTQNQQKLGSKKILEFTDYEVPWRVMDEPRIPVDGRNDNWETADDVIPKHRRVGRKRKRPRDSHSVEELIYADEPFRPYYDMDLETIRKTPEVSNKRQKTESKPRWMSDSDVLDIQRSIGRKVYRKHRPVPSWPVQNPFKHTSIVLDELASQVGSTEKMNAEDHNTEMYVDSKNQADFKEINSSLLKVKLESRPTEEIIPNTGLNTKFSPPNTYIIRDKSLSDLSSEVFDNANKKETTLATDAENAKQMEQDISLKDILKQTSGSSLSEILQQHNVTLTDLLHGKEKAVSVFRAPVALEINKSPYEIIHDAIDFKPESNLTKVDGMVQEALLINSETKYPSGPDIKNSSSVLDLIMATYKKDTDESTIITSTEKATTKVSNRRRYQQNPHRKMYMRPMRNNTHKGQLSRDLVTLNSRKYAHHRKNVTKSHHWKDILPTLKSGNSHRHNNEQNRTEKLDTNTGLDSETMNLTNHGEKNIDIDETIKTVENDPTDDTILQHDINSNSKYMDVPDATTPAEKHIVDEMINVTEKSPVLHRSRPTAIATGLRKHAFNNRLTRKRLKSKNTTTENSQEDLTKHLYGMGDLVSSSEFIERTQKPVIMTEPMPDEMKVPTTTTEDSVPNETISITEIDTPTTKRVLLPIPPEIDYTTTEENAKIEIEEILRDTNAASKLCEILMERNMTLNELVKHRERGSSYIHLADIFHNASREPNPPEPFLSKSLLEPISKETYPLRALLDANSHEPNLKASNSQSDFVNKISIPIGMDFRNNVNENSEKTGIMSLFDKFSKSTDMPTKDAEENNSYNPIINVNPTNENKSSDTRDGRVLNKNQEDDVVSWNEIFSLMGRNKEHDSEGEVKPYKNIRLEEDADGDGVMILEDLQHLKDFDNNVGIGSTEEVDMNLKTKHKVPLHYGSKIFDDVLSISNNSNTKSVTVATASIVGLAIILFLLTYAAFKWKQQRSIFRKKGNFGEEHIPTPVFEHRKGHLHNSSIRSISPMIQTSNHYTINTLDSQTGKESPDYAWDSLRKPFR